MHSRITFPLRRFSSSFATAMKSGSVYDDPSAVYSSVKEYYGKVLNTSSDLKTSACCTINAPPKRVAEILRKIPNEILDKYYGCGNPLPQGIKGLNVLDLGSGSGRDCYLAAAMTGPDGSVTGVDMTDEQLEVANAHVVEYCTKLEYPKPNLKFVKGYIEFLEKAGVPKESMDLVISNCVINLSPDKPRVLQEVYDSLRMGGEFYFSDVYCNRRLPDEIRKHDVLLGECLGGALYIEDFKRICHQVGFTDPRQLSIEPIDVRDEELQELVGEAKFYSITYRCFKLPNLETLCEDYGQIATYKGGIEGHPNAYALDDHHIYEKNRPMLVCGNTASMVGESWLGKYFEVVGNRDVHFGLFDCSPVGPSAITSATTTPNNCC